MQKNLLIILAVVTLASGLTLSPASHYFTEGKVDETHYKINSPCKNGETAYDNGAVKDINGCGSGSVMAKLSKFSGPYTSKFTPCCNKHDVCYETCGGPDFRASHDKCDNEFKKCMDSYCESSTSKKFFSLLTKVCKANGWMLYQAVSKLGGVFYEQSQKRHCACQPVKAVEEDDED